MHVYDLSYGSGVADALSVFEGTKVSALVRPRKAPVKKKTTAAAVPPAPGAKPVSPPTVTPPKAPKSAPTAALPALTQPAAASPSPKSAPKPPTSPTHGLAGLPANAPPPSGAQQAMNRKRMGPFLRRSAPQVPPAQQPGFFGGLGQRAGKLMSNPHMQQWGPTAAMMGVPLLMGAFSGSGRNQSDPYAF